MCIKKSDEKLILNHNVFHKKQIVIQNESLYMLNRTCEIKFGITEISFRVTLFRLIFLRFE